MMMKALFADGGGGTLPTIFSPGQRNNEKSAAPPRPRAQPQHQCRAQGVQYVTSRSRSKTGDHPEQSLLLLYIARHKMVGQTSNKIVRATFYNHRSRTALMPSSRSKFKIFRPAPTTRATSASFTHRSASKDGTKGRSAVTRASLLIYNLTNRKSPHRYKHETNKDGLLEPLPHHPNLLPLSSHKSIAEHPATEKLVGPRSKSAL